jgi:hypothetical protein
LSGGAAPGAALLKEDALGRVERLVGERGALVRRVACGGRLPGSRFVARLLLGRERRALLALASGGGAELRVPRLVEDAEARQAAGPATANGGAGRVPRPGDVLLRSWIEGLPLHRATELPEDFFDLLDELVLAVHRRGVCHNDLHKEQNILVGRDGRPWLVDFQLASVHRRLPAGRAREDLRHVQKHRRRYTRDGRGPQGGPPVATGVGHGLERGPVARLWRRAVKPVYRRVATGLGRRDWEQRRPSSGPWPRWSAPVGPG